jgi:predicted RNase H-like nuclease (RuvC/YqgF family)
LKPLKRQLEEYKVRATDAEVALIECREDLRRLKERSCGLEGVNEELKRGVDAHMAEVGSFQRRLKEGEALESGGGVGIGMRLVQYL